MRIGVALYALADGSSGGLVVVVRELLEAVFAGWPEHEVVLFHTPVNAHLFPAAPAHVSRFVLHGTDYHAVVADCADRLGVDVLFYAYPAECESPYPLARQLVLIPDCQHEFFPEFFSAEMLAVRRESFARVLRGAGAVATLSEHARQTLARQPAARGREIAVLSPALRTDSARATAEGLTAAERELVPRRPYFFFPANLWPHKNHRRLFRAFELFLRKTGHPAELICTGHPAGWDELSAEFPALPVRHLGFVGSGLVQVLMARAKALTFFPLFEGFGMPLLEAFAAGTPVVCGNTTSLPEVGGDAVLTCDPTDTDAIGGLMARVFDDPALRTRLTAAGRERLARFDWHTTAARFIDACTRLAAQPTGPAADPRAGVRGMVELVRGIQDDRERRQGLIAELDAACRARLELVERLDADLRQAHADLRQIHARLDQADDSLRHARAELARSETERAQTHADLERTLATLRQVRSENGGLQMERARLEARLGQLPLIRSVRLSRRIWRAGSALFRRLVRKAS
jgi:glycosyltransferase involved in cell wall biosynthesis